MRSVNVSGANIIKMAALKAFFEAFGFHNVVTYIQSGNIIFDAQEKPSESFLAKKIAERFTTKNVAVFLKTPEDIAEIIRQNPFGNLPGFDVKKLYVHYLEAVPDSKYIEEIYAFSFENEFFSIQDDVIYVYYAVANRGRAKLSNAFFEKKLRLSATARNWNTTNKLLLLATAK